MHAAFGHSSLVEKGVPAWRASFPEARFQPIPESAPASPAIEELSSFSTKRGPNWVAILLIAVFHAGLLFALIKFDVIAVSKPKPKPLVVKLMTLPLDPPPAEKEPEVAPPEPLPEAVVVPKAIVPAPAPAPAPIVVTDVPPPPKAVVVAPPAPPVLAGPVSVEDLSSKMISAPSPRYPVESRRRKEQGTVFLSVLVGIDGNVADVAVSRSSGSPRLDKAALEAVRRWRWSPTMRAGAAVMVRGTVDIPFVLQG